MTNRACPCGNELPEEPALSRYADVPLCCECGIGEALEEESRRELERVFNIVVTSAGKFK